MVTLEEAQALVKEIDRTETLMPIFGPSGYQKIRDSIGDHLILARAFLAFRSALEDLRKK
jgi:hypothetical protein